MRDALYWSRREARDRWSAREIRKNIDRNRGPTERQTKEDSRVHPSQGWSRARKLVNRGPVLPFEAARGCTGEWAQYIRDGVQSAHVLATERLYGRAPRQSDAEVNRVPQQHRGG